MGVSQRDTGLEAKEMKHWLDGIKRGYSKLVKREISPPKWVIEINEFIRGNKEEAVVFTNNATTKYVSNALANEITAEIKLLKTETDDKRFLRIQGEILGLEHAKAYLDKVSELTNV